MRREKKKLPSILIDEHFPPDILGAFAAAGLRSIAVARDRRYRGRDERDYLGEMYANNEIFVTGDEEFVEWLLANRPRHAGVVFIPQTVLATEKLFVAEIAATIVRGAARDRQFALRSTILYGGQDGFRAITPDRSDLLLFSWAWYRQLPDD